VIFHSIYPSGRSMALGSTQLVAEITSRDTTWEVKLPVRRTDNLTSFLCQLSRNSWILNLLAPSRPVQPLVYLLWVYRRPRLIIQRRGRPGSISVRIRKSKLCHPVKNGSGLYAASYEISSLGSFFGGGALRAQR
jgi:hypothetical protein